MGHDIIGTLRANRSEGAPLKDIKEMKKTARGSFHQITDVSSNSTLVRYNDNNIVTIASTESGVQPIGKDKVYMKENNLFRLSMSGVSSEGLNRYRCDFYWKGAKLESGLDRDEMKNEERDRNHDGYGVISRYEKYRISFYVHKGGAAGDSYLFK
ncbi:PiggyBac transposable element-derived protein 2 [Eumeta japonica]|uniref:PiggyBac transposable element-derived protein 2 n=1 Tax=Eumeta variegata TaxID=151549 RepID=A0A4C1TK51_EUMVA|nr:PiggyBac transposable element-derived protein 2 [Eumeta japonica]